MTNNDPRQNKETDCHAVVVYVEWWELRRKASPVDVCEGLAYVRYLLSVVVKQGFDVPLFTVESDSLVLDAEWRKLVVERSDQCLQFL